MADKVFLTGVRQRLRPRRRGMALLIVLGLLSISMVLSFAMLRSQATSLRVQGNGISRTSARQAAVTGMTVALGEMHNSSRWQGVGTTLVRTINSTDSYTVTFTAGDASLTSGSPDYSELPYRVTILSTGVSLDPTQPSVSSTYRIRAVVRLVPKALSSEPSGWSTWQNYALYTSQSNDFRVDLPFRVEGPVRVQGSVRFAEYYPSPSAACDRFLGDLTLRIIGGFPDQRPFSGTIYLPFSSTDSTTRTQLSSYVGATLVDTSSSTTSLTLSSYQTSYKLYAGGPSYTMGTLPSTPSNVTLGPNVATNPLGIYYSAGNVSIGSNVTVQGLLFTPGDLDIAGTNVSISAPNVRVLDGTTNPVRLPVAICNRMTIKNGASGAATGNVVVWNEYKAEQASTATEFDVLGRVITGRFTVERRNEWNSASWSSLWTAFQAQMLTGESNFATYLLNQGLDLTPRIKVRTDSTPRRDFYFRANSNPIFSPASGANGLKWELLDWSENVSS